MTEVIKTNSVEWFESKSNKFLISYRKELEDNIRFFESNKKRGLQTIRNIERVLNGREKPRAFNNNPNNPKQGFIE